MKINNCVEMKNFYMSVVIKLDQKGMSLDYKTGFTLNQALHKN